MWIAKMESETFSWLAAGDTPEIAKTVLADGFLRHLVQVDGDEATAIERFGFGIDRDDITRDELVEVLDDWYGIGTVMLAPGVCLRDMSPIPA